MTVPIPNGEAEQAPAVLRRVEQKANDELKRHCARENRQATASEAEN